VADTNGPDVAEEFIDLMREPSDEAETSASRRRHFSYGARKEARNLASKWGAQCTRVQGGVGPACEAVGGGK
jgi:hypothetical protein